MHACMCVYLYVCVYIYTHTHTHTHTQIYIYTSPRAQSSSGPVMFPVGGDEIKNKLNEIYIPRDTVFHGPRHVPRGGYKKKKYIYPRTQSSAGPVMFPVGGMKHVGRPKL